jgi:hypothetical protein
MTTEIEGDKNPLQGIKSKELHLQYNSNSAPKQSREVETMVLKAVNIEDHELRKSIILLEIHISRHFVHTYSRHGMH